MNSRFLTQISLAAAFAVLLGGCVNAPPDVPTVTKPAVGSSFTYVSYVKDSTGTNIPISENYFTRVITATNVAVAGRTGATSYQEDGQTYNLFYETNGDVSYLQPPIEYPGANFPEIPGLPALSFPARWALFGLVNRRAHAIQGIDTALVLTIPGLPIPIPVTLKVSSITQYAGTDSLRVGSETLGTWKSTLSVVTVFNSPLGGGRTVTMDTLWFAPKLGMFVKDEGITNAVLPEAFGPSGVIGGNSSTLTSYSLP